MTKRFSKKQNHFNILPLKLNYNLPYFSYYLFTALGQNNDGFICCPEEALTWENRKYLIVEEIMQNNPDIVCLQVKKNF